MDPQAPSCRFLLCLPKQNDMYQPLITGMAAAVLLASTTAMEQADTTHTTPTPTMNEKPIIELAVHMVKDGQQESFEQARSAFIQVLTEQDGVRNDREFASFYSLPQPDPRPVFIGMTQYPSMARVGEIQAVPEVQQAFGAFAATMDLKAYAFLQQTEGDAFDLGTVMRGEGQVLEVAVRRTHAGQEADFDRTRKAFVGMLDGRDGVLGSYEFAVVGGPDTERLSVGMTVYRDQQAFNTIAGELMQLPETQAYFATFDVVASQFATAIK